MNTMSDDWEEARKYATWKSMLSEELEALKRGGAVHRPGDGWGFENRLHKFVPRLPDRELQAVKQRV